MSEECHSSVGKHPSRKARVPHELVGVSGSGAAHWRGLDDLADTTEFRGWLEREFPAGASELLADSRRSFLKVMGASIALVGAATIPGCRRPDHKIMPYSANVPEEIVPGKSLYYATSLPLPGGGAEGLLVETHEGRPTKIEGNPLHPVNAGKSSVWSQASILGLYDPDRLKDPIFTGESSGGQHADSEHTPRSWADFSAWWSQQCRGRHDSNGGAGLAFVVDRKTSPSLSAMKARVLKEFPKATWVWYDPMSWDDSRRGAALAFGRPVREVFAFEKARCILSIGRDFLAHEPGALRNNRTLAATRRPLRAEDGMSRLYVAESNFSITGGRADHRLKVAPSLLPAFTVEVGKALAAKGILTEPLAAAVRAVGTPSGASFDAGWIDAIAEDLAANRGAALVVAGPSLPAPFQALVHAINVSLGAPGATVTYLAMSEDEEALSSPAIADLASRLAAGAVDTVVCINCNPVFDAPADTKFGERYAKAATRIALSVDDNETVRASTWRLNGAHTLESWGDTEAVDGTLAPIQPLIAPLYGGRSDIELLAIIAGHEQRDGYDIVRSTWSARLGVPPGPAFEKAWRRALHDGVIRVQEAPAPVSTTNVAAATATALKDARPAGGPTTDALDVAFVQWNIGDGRGANCGWLQELPDPATHIVWDNAALLSPATAERLGLNNTAETDKKRKGRMARVTIGDMAIDIVAWVTPGIPDNTVILPVGYGRRVVGVVGEGAGFDVYGLRTVGAEHAARGARVERLTGGDAWYEVSSTQSHGTMEGRAIVRQVDLPAWRKHADEVETSRDAYGREKKLGFAERLGELAHAPANESIYTNPLNNSPADAAPGSVYAKGPQWGMAIDLSTCTGCNTCTVACQAENNIPIVGKIEVNKGREMQWIRVDRYFVGGDPTSKSPPWDDPHLHMSFQPVACVQCENAPCETVCPVNATVHGQEGINYMAYNRCIGTRYCANNCPYKVRRFNFFQYGDSKYQGGYIGQESMPGGGPKNQNLIPPRLRHKLDEITKMQKNPNVTIRPRGVMEKCNYCLQRINEARIAVKLDKKLADAGIPDGYFQTACQQACPTDSIVFGDLLDTTSNGGAGSRARQMRAHARSYMLLGFLNTRPRTLHMADVRNPNPAIRTANEDPFHHAGHGSEGGTEHGGGEHAVFVPNQPGESNGERLVSLTVLGAGA